jgi:hypothetical protein
MRPSPYSCSYALLACAGLAACSGTSTNPADVTDGGGSPIGFQPSNLALKDIEGATASAQAEHVTASCKVETDLTAPSTDCFQSTISAVQQSDGSTVNLVVVKSLTVDAAVTITVEGPAPFALVSLGDLTLSGTIDAHSALLMQGPGGGIQAKSNAVGVGPLDAPTPYTGAPAGAGGSYCGRGGTAAGGTGIASQYGSIDVRPLLGGASGGSGAVGSGAGGGAVQLVSSGTLTIAAGGAINVGGEGGPISGLATGQNAGGGGSGGSIILEATTVAVAGNVAANGGGGGGSYSGATAGDGTADAVPAPAGEGDANDGAAGGAGGAGATVDGLPGLTGTTLNPGGGGGGVGRIRINTSSGAATTSGVISPATSTLCAIVGKVRAFSDGP